MGPKNDTSINQKFGPSSLWKGLTESVFQEVEIVDLGAFRKPGTLNNRLASWDPISKNLRYYKTILFSSALAMPDRFFEIYSKLDTSIGQPTTVSVRGLPIDLDYFLAVHELLHFERIMPQTRSVCEIGAGFGRTCHTTLTTYGEAIDTYTIVDLAPCLSLSQRYLQKVLPPALFQKVRFLRETDADEVPAHDLFINIDSMAEMDESVAKNYLQVIAQKGKFFFTRNPVAKYRPETLGITDYRKDELEAALSAGLLRTVVDIFNDAELAQARKAFEKAMAPSENWALVSSAPSVPWNYYQNSLFEKKERNKQ